MSKWYTISCEGCGTEVPVHEDWDNPPRFCKSCKEANNAKWYEVSCENCRSNIRANRDWDHPPKLCPECRQTYAPKDASCLHCGTSFTIYAGIQIKCQKNGWDLPKHCGDCRELFRHKPFKTVRETNWAGNTMFRTYNSIGQLISESRDETGFFGDKRRVHRSETGEHTGVTREKVNWLGNHYKETTGPDGMVKSTSRERTNWLGNKYTESTGGSSGTKHITRSKTSWTGKKYRETE
jgi:hypothetical protein